MNGVGKFTDIDQMYRKSMKIRAQKGELSLGMVVNIPNPIVAELAAVAGCDFIRIDMEHNVFNVETVQNIIRAADCCGIATYIRLDQYDLITPLLDFGVEGFMFPHVRSAQQAKELVDLVKYAPIGRRGFCNSGRAHRYGRMKFFDYVEEAGRDTFLQVQIEDKEGIEHMEEIISVPGLDAVCSGRGDIAQALGLLGQGDHEKVTEVEDKIIETAARHGLRCQLSASSPEMVRYYYSRGVRNITIGDDKMFLLNGVQDKVDELRKLELSVHK